jgi:hypothetical protein
MRRMLPNVEGQRREPATGSVRIATRRAGWRPFAGPDGSISLMGTLERLTPAKRAWLISVPDMRDSFFGQDNRMDRMIAGSVLVRDHPVNPVHPVFYTPRGSGLGPSASGLSNDKGQRREPATRDVCTTARRRVPKRES